MPVVAVAPFELIPIPEGDDCVGDGDGDGAPPMLAGFATPSPPKPLKVGAGAAEPDDPDADAPDLPTLLAPGCNEAEPDACVFCTGVCATCSVPGATCAACWFLSHALG